MNTKQVDIKVDGVTVDLEAIRANRKKIMNIGLLGAQYFTIAAVETHPDFDKAKLEHEKSGSLNFFLNRTPRRFRIRGEEVVAQTLKTTPDGTTSVVFNPGCANEAKAAIIDGNGTFGESSDDAIANALSGSSVIFADGTKLAKKANEYNQAEVDRLNAFIRQLQEQRDAIISTIKNNEAIANAYEKEILDSTPKQKIGPGTTSPTIVIQSAATNGDD